LALDKALYLQQQLELEKSEVARLRITEFLPTIGVALRLLARIHMTQVSVLEIQPASVGE
jgi:hypothetical protein